MWLHQGRNAKSDEFRMSETSRIQYQYGYRKSCLNRNKIYKCTSCFKNGQISLYDEKWKDSPSISKNINSIIIINRASHFWVMWSHCWKTEKLHPWLDIISKNNLQLTLAQDGEVGQWSEPDLSVYWLFFLLFSCPQIWIVWLASQSFTDTGRKMFLNIYFFSNGCICSFIGISKRMLPTSHLESINVSFDLMAQSKSRWNKRSIRKDRKHQNSNCTLSDIALFCQLLVNFLATCQDSTSFSDSFPCHWWLIQNM